MRVITHNRNQIIRLLTLVFFFNFSGLNNGIAYMIVSSGNIEVVSFAPALVKDVGGALNPKNWGKTISDLQQLRFLFRAGSIVRFASQSAAQRILIQSTLTQVWFGSFVNKIYMAIAGCGALRGVLSAGIKTLELKSVANGKKSCELANSAFGYISNAKRESWIDAKRFLLDGWRKCRADNSFIVVSMHGMYRQQLASVSFQRSAERFVGIREQILRRVLYVGGEGKDEPANYFTLETGVKY